jgi:hypothetical protein
MYGIFGWIRDVVGGNLTPTDWDLGLGGLVTTRLDDQEISLIEPDDDIYH